MTLFETKSVLAKLLAEEDVSVQHRNMSTAAFDLKNRTLLLPQWQDITPEIYDLLVGHEVGHAKYTPPQGWHTALDGQKKGFKSYLNVVEDARIEKLMKQTFPGLRRSFYLGYQQLVKRGFFGLKPDADLSRLPLIDRINLRFKGGQFMAVPFTEDDEQWIDAVENCETWDDVVRVATALYKRAQEEESQMDLSDLFEQGMGEPGEPADSDGGEEGDPMDGESEEDGEEGDSKKKSLTKQGGDRDEFDPQSMTDAAFRNKEKDLVGKAEGTTAYANLPVLDLKGRVTPWKRVYELMTFPDAKYMEKTVDYWQNFLFQDFKKRNEKYIGYLVKEFELKKNARQHARAQTSTTGELDMKKLHSYRLTEDLFRKMTVVPNGKSHGMMMFIDWSGSMRDNMQATLEQTLVLATFCRKVNIPFQVLSFSDLAICNGEIPEKVNANGRTVFKEISTPVPGNLAGMDDRFHLREYLNSRMSSTEYNTACKKLLFLAEYFVYGYANRKVTDTMPTMPASEGLHGTPLDEAVIAAIQLVPEFRAKFRLDVVSTIFLTDGEGNCTQRIYNDECKPIYINDQVSWEDRYLPRSLVITDKKTRLQGVSKPGQPLTVALMQLLRKLTGTTLVGFYLLSGRNYTGLIRSVNNRYNADNTATDADVAKFKKDRYFEVKNAGYDVFYLIPGGRELAITDDALKVSSDASKGQLRKAFAENQQKKGVNRILLSRFADLIT